MSLRHLTVLETRVLGVLVEKALTVPDTYPLSLNALHSGCNQKTARDPVLQVPEGELQTAVEALKSLQLVQEMSGSRVTRYQHNLARALALPSQSVVLLAVLMLRGPQTAAELRMNAERLYKFADLSSVDGFLEELSERSPDKGGPLVLKLPRAPGSREARWAHLLAGPVEWSALPAELLGAPSEWATYKAQQLEMQGEIDALREQVRRLYAELGLPTDVSTHSQKESA
jgi:uncharacterized protein